MQTVVITGGLGAGKSTAVRYFAERGAAVISFDDLARAVIGSDTEVAEAVRESFGADVFSPDGSLDRARLAERAFASPDAAARLNAIVHPAAVRRALDELDALASRSAPPAVVVVEVPLLHEVPSFAARADHVLAIRAPREARVARAVARGMSEADARRRADRQASDDEIARLADRVIDNSADEATFFGELEAYAREIAGGAGSSR